MTKDMLGDVREAVRTGEFASTSAALRDAVRVWQRQRLEDAERLRVLRCRIVSRSTIYVLTSMKTRSIGIFRVLHEDTVKPPPL